MSSANYFPIGTTFREDGTDYVVIEEGARNRVLRSLATHEVSARTAARLRKLYQSGAIELQDLLTPAKKPNEPSHVVIERSLADYSDEEQDRVKVKLHYLNSLCPRGPMLCRKRHLQRELAKLHQSLPAELPGVARPLHPPCTSSFYEWRRTWINSSFSSRSLVDRYDLRGRRPQDVPRELVPILERSIDELYATGNRPSVSDTLRRAQDDVNRQNRVRPPADQLPVPTRRQLQRMIDRLDRFTLLRRRHGTAHARQATRIFTRKEEPTRLLERVELDHSPLDVICIADETGLVVGRPHLTVLIDVCTRMILGAWISFRPPNASSVLRALKHSILPKDDLVRRYGLEGPWPARGVMSQLVTDNGRELHSRALESAALDLGITLVYCPPRQPFFKGVVERFLQEINYRFIHQLPGTTFAKYYLREEYDSLKHAVIPIEELRKLVYRWVVDVYNKSLHRSLQTCPLEKWNALDGHPEVPALPRRPEVLDVYLTPTEERSLGSKGIEINSLFYTCPELADLRMRGGNQRVQVRPNPDDLGFIYVLHPKTNTYFSATCTWPDYAAGLTQEQHDWFRGHARRKYESLPYHASVLAAKREMQDDGRRMLEAHRELMDKLEKHHKQEKGSAKSKHAKARRGSRSGLETQSRHETSVVLSREEPQQALDTPDLSFEGLDAFATGQTDLL